MTASAAATAVSIVIHYAFTRYNYAFIIAKSTGRAAATIFSTGRDGETSVRLGLISGGNRGRFFAPPSGGGRANKLDRRDDFSFFFSFFTNKLFLSFFPLFRSSLSRKVRII